MQNRKIPSGQQNTQERETYLSFILFSFNHIHVNGLSNHLIIIGIDLLRWQLQEYFYQLTSLNLDTEVDKIIRFQPECGRRNVRESDVQKQALRACLGLI